MKYLVPILLSFLSIAGFSQRPIPSPIPQNVRNAGIFSKGTDTIIWCGDSYTLGQNASSTAKRFSSIVSNALGAVEVNHGIAGTPLQKRTTVFTNNMIDRLGTNVTQKTFGAKMIVFAFGLNDNALPGGGYSPTNYKTDYDSVLHYCANMGWNTSSILIIPPFWVPCAGFVGGVCGAYRLSLLDYVQATKDISQKWNTMYLDIYHDQEKNDTTLFGVDNVHPSDAGYAFIANDILQYLGSVSSGLNLTPNSIVLPGTFTTSAQFTAGGIKMQSYAADNQFLHSNIVYNGGYKYVTTGFGSTINMGGGAFIFNGFPSGTAGTSASPTYVHYFAANGNVIFGAAGVDNGFAKLQVMSATGAQYSVLYDATHHTEFTTGSTGNFTIAPSGGSMTLSGNVTLPLAKVLTITEGTSGRAGQVALVAGTKAITITGLTTSSRAFPGLASSGGTAGARYVMACTANTLTITAVDASGTIVTTDTSTINYFVIN